MIMFTSTLCLSTTKGDILNITLADTALIGHNAPVFALDWYDSEDKMASGSLDGIIRIWNTENGNYTLKFTEHSSGITDLDWSPDGKMIVSGSMDNSVILWQERTGDILKNISLVNEYPTCVEWSPDGSRIGMGTSNGSIYIYTSSMERSIMNFTSHDDAVTDLDWSSNGKTIASSAFNTILIWDVETGNIFNTYHGHTDTIQCLLWPSQPDEGRWLISGGNDGKTIVWDLNMEIIYKVFSGNLDKVYDVEFVKKEETIISAGIGGPVYLWSLHEGEAILSIGDNSLTVRDISFHPGDNLLAMGTANEIIDIYNADPDNDGKIQDEYPNDPAVSKDSDGDGFPNEWNPGYEEDHNMSDIDYIDDFPTDPSASMDSDGDGYPNKWNQGYDQTDSTTSIPYLDDYPDDPAVSRDSDGDGFPDEWNLGKGKEDSIGGINYTDCFPLDPAVSLDADDDGYPDQWNPGYEEEHPDSNVTHIDSFPKDPAASLDSDGDNWPDNWNPGKTDADSTTGLQLDVFPLDPSLQVNEKGQKKGSNISLWGTIAILGIGAFILIIVCIIIIQFLRSKWDLDEFGKTKKKGDKTSDDTPAGESPPEKESTTRAPKDKKKERWHEQRREDVPPRGKRRGVRIKGSSGRAKYRREEDSSERFGYERRSKKFWDDDDGWDDGPKMAEPDDDDWYDDKEDVSPIAGRRKRIDGRHPSMTRGAAVRRQRKGRQKVAGDHGRERIHRSRPDKDWWKDDDESSDDWDDDDGWET